MGNLSPKACKISSYLQIHVRENSLNCPLSVLTRDVHVTEVNKSFQGNDVNNYTIGITHSFIVRVIQV